MVNIQQLMRPEIVAMQPYTPIKPFHVLSAELGLAAGKIVKLDANENPYGFSPKAIDALKHLTDDIPIYPDPVSGDLRDDLATYMGVDSSQVVIGAGADELIELLFKLFVGGGEAIINCPPTFGMYTFCAAVANANEVVIERDKDYQLDIDAIEAAVVQHQAKMVMLCAPNNPDGGYINRAILERLLKLECIVVLDEAYVAFARPNLEGEFGGSNSATLVKQHPNLVVLRTFSKWAGLAGLRCGYGVFDPEIASYLMTIKQPYNVNVAARAAALASLEDLPLLAERVGAILTERDRLYTLLREFPTLKPTAGSHANFILVEVLGGSASELKANLAERGILVRYFAKPRLKNHIRISIGTPSQTDQLMQALRDIIEE